MDIDLQNQVIQRKFLVTSADVDFEGKLRVSSLVNFLIQSAWQHAELLGWGVQVLADENLAWILSSIKLEIKSYAQWKDEITVETWPKGLHRLFYLRDFVIYDSSCNVLAKGTSNWLLIDIEKRRPKMYKAEYFDSLPLKDKHALTESIPVLEFDKGEHEVTPYVVRYSNIDINRHLTTTGYLDFVFDTFDPQFISQNRPKLVTANFLKEVLYGENVVMLKSDKSAHIKQFQLETKESEKPCFRCELEFYKCSKCDTF